MTTVKEHYDTHLGRLYSWMLGDFAERSQQQLQYFREQNILPGENGLALDLGCGNGIQSIALADLGFKVTAVDFNKTLLDELKANAGDRPVTVVEASITDVQQYAQPCGLVVCMGDTISHLESVGQVEQLFSELFRILVPEGKLVISFRDMMIALEGEKRFIPVRSDGTRILTCFLEYHDGYVMVNDLLYENEDGQWKFSASSYKKLRLGLNQLVGMLVKVGFRIKGVNDRSGMMYVVSEAKK
ncbi:MAG TPA: class I SAM-dependent methyltransferase [Chitinophagaceae bacterium]